MHIHLDIVGGIAGDMFAAAMLDAWPEFAPAVAENLRLAGLGAEIRADLLAHNDGVLAGHRFDVVNTAQPKPVPAQAAAHTHDHNHDHDHHHAHDHHSHDHGHGSHAHTPWSELRQSLAGSGLAAEVKRTAIGIFECLAEAEAAVHGRDIGDVVFHEVGNWDSIADIVAAATVIVSVGAKSWSASSLPIGRGFVETAHGRLPVPAPATALLVKGLACHDDGRAGERVTPTGAAVLRFLGPEAGIGHRPRVMSRIGIGFGTRRLLGISNVLRVLAFDDVPQHGQDQVGVIQFEIDDQSGEELAVALDHLRATDGVLDVLQTPGFGKKGRMVMSVQVLTRPEALEAAVTACFRQTTTLGVRTRIDTRSILARRAVTTEEGLRVKIADRPGGATAKAEMDDSGHGESHEARSSMRRRAERQALEKDR